jgi:hypothetical protein
MYIRENALFTTHICTLKLSFTWSLTEKECKRKCRYRKSLKKFTRDNSKKSKKGEQKYKGWSEGGKKFVLESVKVIKDEVRRIMECA